jgi:hypothetical protein
VAGPAMGCGWAGNGLRLSRGWAVAGDRRAGQVAGRAILDGHAGRTRVNPRAGRPCLSRRAGNASPGGPAMPLQAGRPCLSRRAGLSTALVSLALPPLSRRACSWVRGRVLARARAADQEDAQGRREARRGEHAGVGGVEEAPHHAPCPHTHTPLARAPRHPLHPSRHASGTPRPSESTPSPHTLHSPHGRAPAP